MAATLKTDVVGNKTDSTANLTLGSSGATTFGGAVDINSGAIDGTTIGAASAAAGSFTDLTATNIQATSGGPLSIKEDGGSTVISIEADGDVVINPTSASVGTISIGSDVRQSMVMDAKVGGTGYQSGTTSSGVGLGVGAMYAGITGEVKMYGGSSAPEGWVLCDGSRYDGTAGTAYKNLFDVLGTAYGDGDGTSNDFNVPDLRGRIPMGVGRGKGKDAANSDGGTDPNTGSTTSLTERYRGEFGGYETVLLTSAQSGVPAHNHTQQGNTTAETSDLTHSVTDPGHDHQLGYGSAGQEGTYGGGYYGHNSNVGSKKVHSRTTGISVATHGDHVHTMQGSTANNSTANAASAHSNEMPFMCLNFIIKL